LPEIITLDFNHPVLTTNQLYNSPISEGKGLKLKGHIACLWPDRDSNSDLQAGPH
jgi:hypothetical protein